MPRRSRSRSHSSHSRKTRRTRRRVSRRSRRVSRRTRRTRSRGGRRTRSRRSRRSRSGRTRRSRRSSRRSRRRRGGSTLLHDARMKKIKALENKLYEVTRKFRATGVARYQDEMIAITKQIDQLSKPGRLERGSNWVHEKATAARTAARTSVDNAGRGIRSAASTVHSNAVNLRNRARTSVQKTWGDMKTKASAVNRNMKCGLAKKLLHQAKALNTQYDCKLFPAEYDTI